MRDMNTGSVAKNADGEFIKVTKPVKEKKISAREQKKIDKEAAEKEQKKAAKVADKLAKQMKTDNKNQNLAIQIRDMLNAISNNVPAMVVREPKLLKSFAKQVKNLHKASIVKAPKAKKEKTAAAK